MLTTDGAITLSTTALVFELKSGILLPQFDNSNKLASSSFVQRALGNLSGFSARNATGTLTLAELGKCIQIVNTTPAGQIISLLPSSTIPFGAGYWLENLSVNPVTIKADGTELIQLGQVAPNSFTLNPGETIFIHSQTIQWNVFGATAAQVFRSSLATSGYQKLPSGLIIQWGTWIPSATAGNPVGIAFPITFPNEVHNISITTSFIAASAYSCVDNGSTIPTTSGFTARCNINAGEPSFFFAIGK
jgi:hypothetical protein